MRPEPADWPVLMSLGTGYGIMDEPLLDSDSDVDRDEDAMAAMKPRTGDGPMEVTKEGREIVMRVPLEGGGRLVVELNADEAAELAGALKEVVG